MRFVRFQTRGGPRIGLLEGTTVFEVKDAPKAKGTGDMRAFLAQAPEARERAAATARRRAGRPARTTKLLAPIDNPGKLIAVAGGYYTHEGAEKLGKTAIPMLFAKRTDDIRGPGDPITIWKKSPGVVDEIEVALVIGEGGKNI